VKVRKQRLFIKTLNVSLLRSNSATQQNRRSSRNLLHKLLLVGLPELRQQRVEHGIHLGASPKLFILVQRLPAAFKPVSKRAVTTGHRKRFGGQFNLNRALSCRQDQRMTAGILDDQAAGIFTTSGHFGNAIQGAGLMTVNRLPRSGAVTQKAHGGKAQPPAEGAHRAAVTVAGVDAGKDFGRFDHTINHQISKTPGEKQQRLNWPQIQSDQG
jgi:hypothetical protein